MLSAVYQGKSEGDHDPVAHSAATALATSHLFHALNQPDNALVPEDGSERPDLGLCDVRIKSYAGTG